MHDVTIGELMRRLDAMERRMDQRFASASRQIESLQFVGRDHYEVAHQALADKVELLTERLDRSDEEKSRLRLAVLGSFVFPILVAILLAGLIVK